MPARNEEQTAKRRDLEKKIVVEMIEIYCHGNHHARPNNERLCADCQKLADYACDRTDKCPFMSTKTFCSNCPVHCYKKDMQAGIQEVMKYSGPRLIFKHPIGMVYHMISYQKTKMDLQKDAKAQGITVEQLKEENKKAALKWVAEEKKKEREKANTP